MSKKNSIPKELNFPKFNDIDFTKQKVVSFSQYQIYKSCPLKWHNQYILKIKSDSNINLIFGTSMHSTIQTYVEVLFKESGVKADNLNLNELLENSLKNEYLKEFNKINKHISTPEEINEYYNDGVNILKWFKSHRKEYFSNRNDTLIGIELPIQKEFKNNVIFKGSIDLATYNKNTDIITLYDLKTSTKGWNEWAKKDETKISQLVLYKALFSELYNWPIDKIDVEFLILKRKAEPNEFIEFPKRIQSFKPSSGKIKIKQTLDNFASFINDTFDDNGDYINKKYPQNITKLCDYCMFNNTSNCIK